MRDDFGAAAYTTNNGTVNWSGNWTESDTNGNLAAGATGGFVWITGGNLQLRYLVSTFADNFNNQGYGNQTGSALWSAGWDETNDDDLATTTGNRHIYVSAAGNSLYFDRAVTAGGVNMGISRIANVSGATAATISFTATDNGFGAGEAVIARYYTNDGAVESGPYTLATYDGNTAGWSGVAQSFPLPNGAPQPLPAGTVSIRLEFITSGNWNNNGDEAYVTALQISANKPAAGVPAGSGAAITRTTNLAGAASATLAFDFTQANLEAGDSLAVEASADGTNFTVLETFTSATANGSRSYNLKAPTDYTSANTVIRFRVTGGYNDTNEAFNVAFADITYGGSAEAQRPANLANAASATLSFTLANSGTLEAGDTFDLQASTDGGGSWNTVASYDGTTVTDAKSYDLKSPTDYTAAGTVIRFRITGGFDQTNETFSVDDAQILHTRTPLTAVQRPADLANAASATLGFTLAFANLEAGDTFVLEASSDGGTNWGTLASYTSASAAGAQSYDLKAPTDFTAAGTVIRFRITGGFDQTNETFSVDNTQILHTRTPLSAVQRPANLANAMSANLGFTLAFANLEAGDTFVLEASSDGGTNWGTLASYTSASAAGAQSHNLKAPTDYTAAGTVVRFRITGGFDQTDETFSVDNVDIGTVALSTFASGNPPAFLRSSTGCQILPGGTLTLTYSVTVDSPLPSGITSATNTAAVTTATYPIQLTASVTDQLANPSALSASVAGRVWLRRRRRHPGARRARDHQRRGHPQGPVRDTGGDRPDRRERPLHLHRDRRRQRLLRRGRPTVCRPGPPSPTRPGAPTTGRPPSTSPRGRIRPVSTSAIATNGGRRPLAIWSGSTPTATVCATPVRSASAASPSPCGGTLSRPTAPWTGSSRRHAPPGDLARVRHPRRHASRRPRRQLPVHGRSRRPAPNLLRPRRRGPRATSPPVKRSTVSSTPRPAAT